MRHMATVFDAEKLSVVTQLHLYVPTASLFGMSLETLTIQKTFVIVAEHHPIVQKPILNAEIATRDIVCITSCEYHRKEF